MSAVTTTFVETPAGQREFPPFDRETFGSQLLWLILTYLFLYWLMAKVGLPRVERVLAERKKRIDEDLAEAQRFRRRAETSAAEDKRMLTAARNRAQSILSQSYVKQAKATQENHGALDLRLKAQIKAANERIAVAKGSAVRNIELVVADTASAIVERLLGSVPSRQTVSAFVSDVVRQ